MAKKVTIKETPTDDRLEEEASRNRIKPRYKSGSRGARNYKITILIPQSLNDELKILSSVLDRPTGDVINEFLEGYVRDNQDKIERFRKALETSRE